jgi:hypothetical protein
MRGSTFRGTPSALVPGDPSKPCRKCWDRHSRNYDGQLLSADWEGNANGTGGTNYQRPISDPPPVPGAYTSAPSASPAPAHSRTLSDAGLSRSNRATTSGPLSPQYMVATPRGSTVVRPGDPRIGGRRCWRCDGTGVVTMFFFDQAPCRACGGLGRVI